MSAERPNILVVVIDCARSDHWLGPGRPTRTPNMDRLCRTGVALPTTIVETPCTTPSFATLLTGVYSPRHGIHAVWGYRLPDSVALLTERLAAAGYHTYAEVSGPLLPEMGLSRGFDEYNYRAPCDYLHTAWGDDFLARLGRGGFRSPWFILLHLWELHPHRQVSPECAAPEFGANTYERAVSSLDRQLGRLLAALDGDTLLVVTGDHGEKLAEDSYRPGTAVDYVRQLIGTDGGDGLTPYGLARWAGPSVLQELVSRSHGLLRTVRLRGRSLRVREGRWTRWRDRLRLLRLTPFLFLHDLLALDRPLKLTRMLRRRGLLDPTRSRRKVERFARSLGSEALVDLQLRMWVNSYKRNLVEGHLVHVYDFLVRVPLVLHWPGHLRAGAVHRQMVRQVDILPTILDLVGLGVDGSGHETDGRSFRTLLAGGAYRPAAAFLSVGGGPVDLEIRGVRTEGYKYSFGPENDELPQELYDLRNDPRETHNLAARRPELCARLRELADGLAQARPAVAAEPVVVSQAEQAHVEQQLRDLGYLE